MIIVLGTFPFLAAPVERVYLGERPDVCVTVMLGALQDIARIFRNTGSAEGVEVRELSV